VYVHHHAGGQAREHLEDQVDHVAACAHHVGGVDEQHVAGDELVEQGPGHVLHPLGHDAAALAVVGPQHRLEQLGVGLDEGERRVGQVLVHRVEQQGRREAGSDLDHAGRGQQAQQPLEHEAVADAEGEVVGVVALRRGAGAGQLLVGQHRTELLEEGPLGVNAQVDAGELALERKDALGVGGQLVEARDR